MKKENNLPEMPPNCPSKPPRFKYQEKYGVVVMCNDENHHQAVYETLKKQGYTCRLVRV